MAEFPFGLIETTGDQAFNAWLELKRAGRGAPVVLGNDKSLEILMETLSARTTEAVADIIRSAERLRHPEDRARQYLLQSDPDAMPFESEGAEVGEWPAAPSASTGLSVAFDVLSRRPLQRVHIALVPTDDWTTIPAHFLWGGWNECPAPEYHVAALRSWRDRFDAELVGLTFDVMNVRVGRRPDSRGDALTLAREQYLYCNDIVDQGVETLSALAAYLMADEWWYAWGA
jgi:hypothetical protein